MSRNWYIDTNLLAVWAMARGGVLERIQRTFGLPEVLVEAYRARFSGPVRLFDAMDAHVTDGGRDQVFASTLALNELLRAIKHEVTAALAFQRGIPVSLWRNRLHNPSVDEAQAHDLLDATLRALAHLQERHHLQVIEDKNPVNEDRYWGAYGPLLFLADHAETMDATLATTAVLHGADRFVTQDRRFRDGFNRRFSEVTGMRVLNAQQAASELRP